MNCLEIQELISLYIDDQLDEYKKEEVKNHLKECHSCKEEYENMLECISLCKDLPMIDLPEGFEESLHEKLVGVQKSKYKKSMKKINWKLFTSAAAMLVIGITSMSIFNSTKDIDKEEMSPMQIDYSKEKGTKIENNMKSQENSEKDIAENKKDIEALNIDERKHLSQKKNNDPIDEASKDDILVEEKAQENAQVHIQDNTPKMTFNNRIQQAPMLSMQQSSKNITGNVFMTIHISKDEFVQMVENMGGNLETSKAYKVDSEKIENNFSNMEEIIVHIPQEKLSEFEKKVKELGEVKEYSIDHENITKDYENTLEEIKNLQTQEIKLKQEINNHDDLEEIEKIQEKIDQVNENIDQLKEKVKKMDEEIKFCTIYVSLYDE